MHKIFKKVFLLDLLFLSLLTTISLALISFYFDAQYLQTGYADWIVQSFRIKLLEDYGFTSWVHAWSNGISIWRSYQFIPHYLTLGIAELLHLEIHRAMVIMTIVQFVGLRLLIYFILRLLSFSPLTAFICAILSFAIGQYWSGIGDYSLLFAFTFFPLIIFAWTKYHQGKIKYVYPYIAGSCFYMHPLLGFSAMGLWVLSVILSEKKIISWPIFIQFLIILATSSLFWFPIVSKLSYFYSNPVFSTQYFLDFAISKYSYYGLSLFLFLALGLSFFWMFKPLPAKLGWAKVLLVFSLIYLTLIIVGVSLDLPGALYQFQYSRGTTLIGIAILFTFAVVVERIIQLKSRVFKGVVVFIFLLSLIEGLWFTSIYSPQPIKKAEDVVAVAHDKQLIDTASARVFTPTIHWSSYLGPADAKYPYSYMEHMDSNQIPQRLSQLMFYHPYFEEAPDATLQRLSDYYKITGTRYLIFEKSSPFTYSYKNKTQLGYKDLGEIETSTSLYHGFEVPWETRNSVLVDQKDEKALKHFPFDLKFSSVNDQIALDDYVKRLSGILYKSENIPLSVVYPTPDTLQVSIPANRASNLVYINESHDIGWKAYFDGREQKIRPSGPNFMLVSLDNKEAGGELVLKHSWPVYFHIGVFLILLIPIQIVIARIYLGFIHHKKKQ
ncbi:MAG: hypothetical protein AAB553_06870 [Patescibacteria group bacterium]